MADGRKIPVFPLLIAGLFGAPLFLWYFVLDNVAVYRSISVAPGTVITQNFHLNYSGYYRIGIQAERKFPHRELQCLLGINDWLGPKDCKDVSLRYAWTLSCGGGKMMRSGSSEKLDVEELMRVTGWKQNSEALTVSIGNDVS